MTRRYLFLCPDRTSASGGVAVIYDAVALLNRAGYEAAVLHNSPVAGYPDYPIDNPSFFTRKIHQAEWNWIGPQKKLRRITDRVTSLARPHRLRPLDQRPTDVIVTPEFMMPEAISAFGAHPIVVFVQNPFSMMRAHDRAVARGLDPSGKVFFWLSIADVCGRHLEMLGARNVAYLPVSMKPEDFPFKPLKQDLITYMPRKRPWEARIIDRALRSRGKLGTYRLEALDGIPRTEVARKLGESRIFISLLRTEALGFPAAEAMASGAIVVGFDGLGCAEYFDNSTGIPVTEGDVAGVVTSVERVIADYAADPEPFDAMRARASQRVREKYSVEKFEQGIRNAWTRLAAALDAETGAGE
jgi:hypothetical protein